jgi:tRNA-Thr(GGU) m(6)t(6)A37 methyltransferase TsaA
MEFTLKPIGLIHTEFTDRSQMPIQATRSQSAGWLEVDTEYQDGLLDVEGFSHLILVYLFHLSAGYDLQVQPFLDDHLHGVFATRHPRRPNPIGLSVVRLRSHSGRRLDFVGADMLDETPLLDIKPYIAEFDHFNVDHSGWYEQRAYK